MIIILINLQKQLLKNFKQTRRKKIGIKKIKLYIYLNKYHRNLNLFVGL